MKNMQRFATIVFLLGLYGLARSQQLTTKGEYFFDTDPGVGQGTAIAISTPSDSVNLVLHLSTSSLSTGFHHVYFRFMNSSGTWGLQQGADFFIFSSNIDTASSPAISGAEYFFDSDPGVGKGTSFSVGTSSDSVNAVIHVPTGSLATGFHRLYVRFQCATSQWGLQDGRDFFIINASVDTSISPQITGAEFFFDNDPGVGHGTSIPISTPSDSVNLALNIPVGALAAGFHHLYFRFQYSSGRWGLYDGRDFYVIPAGITGSSPPINYAEYFFDNDPGVGRGTAVSISPAADSVNIVEGVSTTGLSGGIHRLYFRFRYTTGIWGLYAAGDTVTICNPPTVTIHASGPATYCLGGSVTLTSDTSKTWSYQWQRNGLSLPGDTNYQLLVTDSSGIYDVVITDTTNCPGISDSITVTVNYPSAYSYSQGICAGQYYVFNGDTLRISGTYKDTLNSVAGCDSFVTLTLTASSYLTQTVNASVCPGQIYVFYGDSITVPNTYYDTVHNNTGCDSLITLNLTLASYLTQSITASICTGQSYIFYGDTITAAGTYRDTVSNPTGCDSVIALTLNISNITDVIVAGGPAILCSGSSLTLTSDSLAGWSLQWQQNGVNISNDTSSSIQVNEVGAYDAVVTTTTGCTDTSNTITVTAGSATYDSISQTICEGQQYIFNGDTLTAAGSYNDTLQNSIGCDSIVTLTLVVNPLPSVSIGSRPDSVCSTSANVILLGIPTGGNFSGSGVTDSVLIPSEAALGNDTITYTYSDSSGCSNSAIAIIEVKLCTGIVEVNNANFTMYPNPTDGLVNIKGTGIDGSLTITLHDVMGRSLLTKEISADRNAFTESIDLSDMAAGFYFIDIRNDSGIVFSKVIAKDTQ